MTSALRAILNAATRKSWPTAITWLLFALFLMGLPLAGRDWATLARVLVYAAAFVLFAFGIKLLAHPLFRHRKGIGSEGGARR